MNTNSMTEWAKSYSWKLIRNQAYGKYRGYYFTVFDTSNIRLVLTALPSLTESESVDIYRAIEENKEGLRIVEHGIFKSCGNLLRVSFTEATMKAMTQEDIGSFFDQITDLLSQLGISATDNCFICSSDFGTQETLFDNILVPLCGTCYDHLEQEYIKAEQEFSSEEKKYGLGFIGALLGGLLATIPWILLSYHGWYVGIIGFLIMFLSLKGYKLLGARIGRLTPWIVGGLTIFLIVLAELVANLLQVSAALKEVFDISPSLGQTFGVFIELLKDSTTGILRGVIINLLIGIVIGLAGTISLFKDMKLNINKQVDAYRVARA